MKRASLRLPRSSIKKRIEIRDQSRAYGVRRLFILKGVARDAASCAESVFRALDSLRVASDVNMYVVPGDCVAPSEGSQAGFGVTMRNKNRKGVAVIVAGRNIKGGGSRKGFLRVHLPMTIAHEWAHVEQWQSKGLWQERGINVRARTLLREASKRSVT